ncbi:unnamed protein product [Brassica rapa subsp. trilocularis]
MMTWTVPTCNTTKRSCPPWLFNQAYSEGTHPLPLSLISSPALLESLDHSHLFVRAFWIRMAIKDETEESCGSRAVVSVTKENPRQQRMKLEVYGDVLQRIQESNYEEANLPDFDDHLWLHFNRLPARYAMDVNVERAEDVLTHQRLLKLAEDPATRPVFEVRCVQVSPSLNGHSTDTDASDPAVKEDAQSSYHSSRQGSSSAFTQAYKHHAEDDDSAVNAQFPNSRPMHEITFSTIDKPKLLSQLTALLGELGLNIQEAHAFSTADGFSLDVFVVDGWSQEETKGLKDALKKEILKLKDQPSSRQKSITFFEHDKSTNELLPACVEIPTDGTDEWEIDMKQLKIEKKVACGSYGELYKGTYCSQEVAIKILKPERVNTEMLREFSQEVYIMRKVRHKNVVQFIGACTRSPNLCIVTEFMARGSIYDFLHKQKGVFKLQSLLKVALDVSKGMNYLHQNNIIHRDLKTANLLMDEHDVVKVADFGVARVQTQSGVMTAETGTYRWMAPEVIEHKPYDHRADVFSYAIVLWELLTGELPYSYLTPLQAAVGVVQKGLRPKIPKQTHPKLTELLEKCWQQDPAQRPDFAEIKEMVTQLLHEVGDEEHQKGKRSGYFSDIDILLELAHTPKWYGRHCHVSCYSSVPEDAVDSAPSLSSSTSSSTSEVFINSPRYNWFTVLGGIGMLDTAYLTYLKLTGSDAFCPVGGGTCGDVLNSDYALVFVTALSAQLGDEQGNLPFGVSKTNGRFALFAATTTMASASAYFLYILSTKLSGSSCMYCLVSAFLSFSLFFLSLKDVKLQEIQQVVGLQICLAIIVVASLTASYSTAQAIPSRSGDIELPYYSTEITTSSSPYAVALAKHLNSIGAKMYGAFWCSHCLEQKEMFGREAAKLLNYVECFPEGYKKGIKIFKACSDARIEGFPTWMINGQVSKTSGSLLTLFPSHVSSCFTSFIV